MIVRLQRKAAYLVVAVSLHNQPSAVPFAQNEPDGASVIRLLDASVQSRYNHVLGFTDIEHYQVFRGKDEAHAAAEMTVKDTYKRGVGKTYEIQSQSGSTIIRHLGLQPLLDNEKAVNIPGNVEKSWFNSANYEMKVEPGGPQPLDERSCYVVDVTARQKAGNTINGKIWVDASDGALVKIDGIASKSPSTFAGATHLMRQYIEVEGYPMAAHARAESNSAMFGRTVVTIDYSEYRLTLLPGK